jgi:hypothetical protein
MTAYNSAVKVLGKLKSPIFKPRSSSLSECNSHVAETTGLQATDGFCFMRSRFQSKTTR